MIQTTPTVRLDHHMNDRFQTPISIKGPVLSYCYLLPNIQYNIQIYQIDYKEHCISPYVIVYVSLDLFA